MADNTRQQATTEREDGVNESGLDYRAGWVEALGAVLQRLAVEAFRSKPSEGKGIGKAHEIAREMRLAMLAKMKGGG